MTINDLFLYCRAKIPGYPLKPKIPMIILYFYGHRTVCIYRDEDNEQACSNCNSLGVDVAVYRKYFHFFFVPIAPSGPKSAKITCPNCREPKWFKGKAALYEKATRTPLYFYTGSLIVAGITLLGVLHKIWGT